MYPPPEPLPEYPAPAPVPAPAPAPQWGGWSVPPPPPPPPTPPGVASRRVFLAAVLAIALIGIIAVAAGHKPAATPGQPQATGGTSLDDVARTVININGHVPGGTVAGTGMVLTSDGLILTNNHVVAGTTSLTGVVAGSGETPYRASVIGVDPTQDIAVIQLEGASGLPVTPFDTSGVVSIGDHVTGMGNALGKNGAPVRASGTVTSLDDTLVVSGEGAGAPTETLNGLIQFDARIQPGDSGGPLFNEQNKVIGMDTAGVSAAQAGAGQNNGAAIPIGRALGIAHQIRTGVVSPYLQGPHSGVLGVNIDPGGSLLTVAGVVPGDAAEKAGIRPGDVITDVGASHVATVADLTRALQGQRPGDHVTVGWRDSHAVSHHADVALSPGPPA